MRRFLFVSLFVVGLSHTAAAADAPSVAAPAGHPDAAPAGHPAIAPAVEKLTFTNKLIDGKKTWLPADAKIKAGHAVELTLINTLADPHGFSLPGMTSDIVVGGHETKTVALAAPKAGTYKFHCQLHPAHVGGAITVQ
jgi:plastocyanin